MDDDGSRIITDQNDEMEKSSSEWDGSEASFVEDNDGKEYGEEYSGIRISYRLTKSEIYQSIKRAGYYKINRIKTIVETVILSIALLIFLVSFFIYGNTVNIVMSFICALVLGTIWLIPQIIIRRQVELQKAKSNEITIDVYPDEIEVNRDTGGWQIQLDSTTELQECDDMFILYLPNMHIFIIPIRAIEPNVLGDIGSILKAGTTPK